MNGTRFAHAQFNYVPHPRGPEHSNVPENNSSGAEAWGEWMDPVRDPAIHMKLDERLKSSRVSGGLGCEHFQPSLLNALSVTVSD